MLDVYWTIYRRLVRHLNAEGAAEVDRVLDADPIEEAKRRQLEQDDAFLAQLGWSVSRLDEVMVSRGK